MRREPSQLASWYDEDVAAAIAACRQQQGSLDFFTLHKAFTSRAPNLSLSEAKFVVEEYCQRHGIELPLGRPPLGARVVLVALVIVLQGTMVAEVF